IPYSILYLKSYSCAILCRKVQDCNNPVALTDVLMQASMDYKPQKITKELLRQVPRARPPKTPREVRDSRRGMVLRHQPSGYTACTLNSDGGSGAHLQRPRRGRKQPAEGFRQSALAVRRKQQIVATTVAVTTIRV